MRLEEFIDNVDVDARTNDEKAIVGLLTKLYYIKLEMNMDRKIIMNSYDYSPSIRVIGNKKADEDPAILELSKRLNTCGDALDAIFRSRMYTSLPVECSNLTVSNP